ncbi:MAG: ThuA domain-containing protein [Cellvibrio sp.]|nr:ThuA domain-containing protein [Cellvibrio sp.]
MQSCRFVLSLIASLMLVVACDSNTSSADKTVKAPAVVKPAPLVVENLQSAKVLVFSKTKGWRHDSIPEGINTFNKLAQQEGFSVVATEDSAIFNDKDLQQFNAIVFLNTTLDILDANQELAMERYIQAGGGFVGIHAAADTEWEGDWFWYRNLVGAVFKNHPMQPSNVQQATVKAITSDSPLLNKISAEYSIADEWYNYRDIYTGLNVLQEVDEKTYQGGEHGDHHSITWMHEYDGGRAFYTGMGHRAETFQNAEFQQLLVNGLKYAVGKNYLAGSAPQLNYRNSRPESNRFVKKTLIDNLNEPVKFDFFPNGDALIALRPGKLVRIDYKTNQLQDAGKVNTTFLSHIELGLVGVTIDPEFPAKPYIYTVYSVQDAEGKLSQQLVRFNWKDNQIDPASEKMILQHGVDNSCCHTGGDLQFGKNRELFYSTGDNTNPHEQDGYNPIDFREDKPHNDALRGAGNTQDLRGKVLRIRVSDDGSYTIPEGNLFKGAAQGRPEIYVMGARNPYTITLDEKTGHLFYGDVGPDGNQTNDMKGSRGFDEVNRVTQAGNFGWPLVIGQNQPYKYYDYVNQKTGDWVDPQAPKNISPRNTGMVDLPPAQPAWIAYPYAVSEEFPEMGSGGRTALVADVYHSENYPASTNRYPAYYDNKLFIVDFVRSWVKAVSFDSQSGEIFKIEPFAPQIKYALPIDAKFAPDGTLYVLEYGMSWFTQNPDARLSRLEYVGEGNRPPVAKIQLDKTQSSVPVELTASAQEAYDPDGDKLSLQWTLACVNAACAEKNLGQSIEQIVSIADAGRYELRLKVTDPSGLSSEDKIAVDLGNQPATIAINLSQNRQFYWPDTKKISYDISINDKEDGVIVQTDGNNPAIVFAVADEAAVAQGHQEVDVASLANDLIDANNCLGCHNMDERRIGPSYKEVAAKYKQDPNALEYLVNKMANGGSGAWGQLNMPAFPGLSEDNRRLLASYILSLANEAPKNLPLKGEVTLPKFDEKNPVNYQLSVAYLDKAQGEIPGINVSERNLWIPSYHVLNNYLQDDELKNSLERAHFNDTDLVKVEAIAEPIGFAMGEVDLTQVKGINLYGFSGSETSAWIFEIREGDAKGPVIATGKAAAKSREQIVINSKLDKPRNGLVPLYINIISAEKVHGYLFTSYIEFVK